MNGARLEMLVKIAKSQMSKISQRHDNPIVAHLATAGTDEPLCQAALPKRARWLHEGEPGYAAQRDCRNCLALARRAGLR